MVCSRLFLLNCFFYIFSRYIHEHPQKANSFFLFFKNFQEIKFTSDIERFANPQFEYCDRQMNSRVAYPELLVQMPAFSFSVSTYHGYLPWHNGLETSGAVLFDSAMCSILKSPPFLRRCTRLTETKFLSAHYFTTY